MCDGIFQAWWSRVALLSGMYRGRGVSDGEKGWDLSGGSELPLHQEGSDIFVATLPA